MVKVRHFDFKLLMRSEDGPIDETDREELKKAKENQESLADMYPLLAGTSLTVLIAIEKAQRHYERNGTIDGFRIDPGCSHHLSVCEFAPYLLLTRVVHPRRPKGHMKAIQGFVLIPLLPQGEYVIWNGGGPPIGQCASSPKATLDLGGGVSANDSPGLEKFLEIISALTAGSDVWNAVHQTGLDACVRRQELDQKVIDRRFAYRAARQAEADEVYEKEMKKQEQERQRRPKETARKAQVLKGLAPMDMSVSRRYRSRKVQYRENGSSERGSSEDRISQDRSSVEDSEREVSDEEAVDHELQQRDDNDDNNSDDDEFTEDESVDSREDPNDEDFDISDGNLADNESEDGHLGRKKKNKKKTPILGEYGNSKASAIKVDSPGGATEDEGVFMDNMSAPAVKPVSATKSDETLVDSQSDSNAHIASPVISEWSYREQMPQDMDADTDADMVSATQLEKPSILPVCAQCGAVAYFSPYNPNKRFKCNKDGCDSVELDYQNSKKRRVG